MKQYSTRSSFTVTKQSHETPPTCQKWKYSEMSIALFALNTLLSSHSLIDTLVSSSQRGTSNVYVVISAGAWSLVDIKESLVIDAHYIWIQGSQGTVLDALIPTKSRLLYCHSSYCSTRLSILGIYIGICNNIME